MTSDDALDDRLACGARVDALLDQVSAGRAARFDAHQAECPHCQAALGEYDRVWAPVRAVAATEVRAPDSVLEAALRHIRGTAADPTYGTLPGPTGTTRISARVVVVTARQTAQDIAGVRVALSKLVNTGATDVPADPDGPGVADPPTTPGGRAGDADAPRVVAGVAGASTAIELTLAADYGTDLVALGERIRAQVSARVRDLTGLEPVTVTVRIDDVFE